MRKYPVIGAPGVIPTPTQILNPHTGIILDMDAFVEADGELGVPINILEGMILQNEGATARLTGRIAVFFQNTDVYGGADLEVTPSVTATLKEVCSQEVAAVEKTIVIPPGDLALIGPFSAAHEDSTQKVTFSFEGEEGRCYAIYLR